MAHFARVENGIVKEVIVAEQDYIDNMVATEPGEWIQTSYNTKGGVHKLGGTPLRYNYATVDGHYDVDADAFYGIKPYNSWTLNTDTYTWEAPVERPGDAYIWNEQTQSWDAVETE